MPGIERGADPAVAGPARARAPRPVRDAGREGHAVIFKVYPSARDAKADPDGQLGTEYEGRVWSDGPAAGQVWLTGRRPTGEPCYWLAHRRGGYTQRPAGRQVWAALDEQTWR